jgi:hypothetical protein
MPPCTQDPQLVGLHLPEVARLLDQVLVHGLALLSRPSEPTGHRAFVEAEGRDDGLNRTAVGQQGDDECDRLDRRAQPVEGRALALGERLAALLALEAPFLLRMDHDVALARLSPGGALGVRAECLGRVHGSPPANLHLEDCPPDPVFSSAYLVTFVVHG